MTADMTPRNGSLRVHPDLMTPSDRAGSKIQRNESGSSGRTVNSVEAESSPTVRNRILDKTDSLVVWMKDFFVPPRWLAESPPGWAELTAYAHHSVRMQNAPGLVKALSSIWLYAVALPAVAMARFREWVLTRPGRAILFILVADLFIRTTPMGHWIAWVIREWFAILAFVFLP